MIGATTSKSLDLTLLNKGDMVYGTSTIKVEIGLKIGNTIEYIPMGIYNIDDIEKTDYTIKITAFDNMMKFEKNFITNLGDTLTLQQVVNELVRITGVQFTGTLPSYSIKKLEGFSCREVLSYVASLCGGNAVITRDGKFTIVTPKDINYAIGTANYFIGDYTREETKYKIGKISCQVADKVLSKGSLGSDSMELEFENPWVNSTILNDIYTKLNGFEYLGYNMKWQGDLALDVGDIVTITDKKGIVRKHPILSQKFTYTGGLTSEIGAKGENKNKNEFSSSGSTAKKVERIVTELAIVNKALIDVAYIGDLTAGNIKFDTASGTIMDLQTLLSKFVTGENGQFLNLTTDNVVIANAVIKDAMIESVNAGKIKTGTIDTNLVRISSTDGSIAIANNTMQFKDKNNKVRIQMGQDTQGNFSFILRGTDGTTTLIDHTGIKEKAIADKLIKSNMVADNAIGEQQLNYSSLVTGLNKDTNTQLIKASKVAIDLTGQSLEVAFNSLKSNVENMEIGVENLFLNADFRNGKNNWSGSHSANIEVIDNPTSEKLPIPAKKVMKLTGATGQKFGFITQTINCGLDTEYTVSFWCYFPDAIPEGVASISVYYENSGWKGITNVKITERNKWIKKSLTFKSNKTFDNLILALGFSGIETSGKVCYCCLAKIEKGNKATDFTLAPKDIEEKIQANTTSITAVQGKIEGLIKESSITKGDVTTLKDNYTNIKATVDGINTTVSSHTTSITNAQNTANKANSLADSKAKVFTSTPTIPYKIGDLWVQGTGGDVMRCKVTRTSGNYTASDWEKASKYTDDTKANAVEKNLNTLGGKVTTVETKQASLEQNLNGFKTTVSSTYTTKTELSTVDGKVTSLTTRVNRAESSITQLDNKIALKVDVNGIISAINMSPEQISISASKINMSGNLDLTGTFKCYENGSNKSGAYLYQYGATQKGYRPGIANPVFSSGIWKPDNINQTGYISVGWTNADKHDVNGCLYMTPIVGGGGRLVYGRTDEKGIGVGESGINYQKNGRVEYRSFLPNRGESGIFSHAFDGGLSCYSIHCNDIYSEGNIRTLGNIYTNNDILFLCSGGNNPTYYLNLRKDGYFFPNGSIQLGTNHAPFYKLVSTLSPEVVSDGRKKENIQYIKTSNTQTFSLAKLSVKNDITTCDITIYDMYEYIKSDLKLASYTMKDARENDKNRIELGFIAQDVCDTKIGKYIVNSNDKDNLVYDMANRISVLEGALQASIKIMEELKEQIIQLRA